MFDSSKEIDRLHRNQDCCLQAFEDIMLVCQATSNYKIAKIIEKCLDELVPPNQEI